MPVKTRWFCVRWVGNMGVSVCAQAAVDYKSSQGNVTIMQEKNVSGAAKFGLWLSHTLSNLPQLLGKFQAGLSLSLGSSPGICSWAFFPREKIVGGSLSAYNNSHIP